MQEVTIAEAARCLGMSIDSIRRRIAKNELKARKVPSPHGEIYLVELPDDAIPTTATRQQPKKKKIIPLPLKRCARLYLFWRLNWNPANGKFKNFTYCCSKLKNNYLRVRRKSQRRNTCYHPRVNYHGGAVCLQGKNHLKANSPPPVDHGLLYGRNVYSVLADG